MNRVRNRDEINIVHWEESVVDHMIFDNQAVGDITKYKFYTFQSSSKYDELYYYMGWDIEFNNEKS